MRGRSTARAILVAWHNPPRTQSPRTRAARAATPCRASAAKTRRSRRRCAPICSRAGSDSGKNDKRYPGHPDIVLPKYRTIVFVNGCFWHMHEGCESFHMPKSNVEFWAAKLTRNRDRDRRQHEQLRQMGWRVIDVWECELRGDAREARLERLVGQIAEGV